MSTQLRWLASHSASCLHLADGLRRQQRLVDPALFEAVAVPADELIRGIDAAGLPQGLWEHLVALSTGIENNRQLAETALIKTVGRSNVSEVSVTRLAGWIADLESAMQIAQPRLVDELALRGGPLREQWEARGPGMLYHVGRLTEPLLMVPNADVVLVYPAYGGGGRAHLLYNSVRIEAVLTNPIPELPEVVRLAWLLAQLNIDLPAFSENLRPQRRNKIAQLAMLPVTLRAAEEVELARCDPAAIQLALKAWDVPASRVPIERQNETSPQPESDWGLGEATASTPNSSSADAARDQSDLANVLLEWWQTYVESRPRWAIALLALDRMLAW
jgi:hypothetical protein